MRKIFLVVTVIALCLLTAVACRKSGSETGQSAGAAVETAGTGSAESNKNSNDKIGYVIVEPAYAWNIKDGYAVWAMNLSLGDELVLLGKEEKAPYKSSANAAPVDFDLVKVKIGEKETWIRRHQMVSNADLAVVTPEQTFMYDKADIKSISKVKFPRLSIIAVLDRQDSGSFVKITGYNPEDKTLYTEKFMKKSDVSTISDDVQTALILRVAAMENKTKEQKLELLRAAQSEYAGSNLIATVETLIDTLTNERDLTRQVSSEIFSAEMTVAKAGVSIWDAPNERSNLVAKVGQDEAVVVVERTVDKYTTGDATDHWYHIIEPKDGWIFGGNLKF